MKITEVYINKEEISEYQLHESLGVGYQKLIDIAEESINNALETYNKALEELNKDNKNTKANDKNKLDINTFIIDEETGLKVEIDDKNDVFVININEKDCIPFKDYFVYDGKILFRNPLEIGSIIKITEDVDKTKIVTKNSYNRNALFHIFSSDQKFKYNNNYIFAVNINEEEFKIDFETQYDPYYSSVKAIRRDMGSCINGVTDNQIAGLIFQHSKEAFITATNNDKLDDLTDIEKEQYIQNIVRYNTDIDLCWLLYYAVSGKYGTISKQIGTIEIEKTTKLPYIETMLKRFQDKLKELEDQLNDGTDTVYSFVKAGDTDYTVPVD